MTARAVASTADLVELAFPLLEPGGILVAWKRGDLDAELARGATGDRTRSVAGRSRSATSPVAGLPGHRLVVATRPGACPPPTRAIRPPDGVGRGDDRASRVRR